MDVVSVRNDDRTSNGKKSPLPMFQISVLFIIGLLASQRILLGQIQPLMSIIPIAFYWISVATGGPRNIEATFILPALYLLVDNGGGIYSETPSFLRYLVYLSAIYFLASHLKWRADKTTVLFLIIFYMYVVAMTISNIFNDFPFSWNALWRDAIIVVLLTLSVFSQINLHVNWVLIYALTFGYLIGELINAMYFYDIKNGGYLNFSSVKVFVIFPLLYSMERNYRRIIQILLLIISILILITYGTRMILLSFIILGIVLGFIHYRRIWNPKNFLLAACTIALLISSVSFISSSNFSAFKTATFLVQIYNSISNGEIIETLRVLDPVRFAEHTLFFDRSWCSILFGSGLGSGLPDQRNLLGFVSINDTAFSKQELNAREYFNLHDMWIDFGLRFGLIGILYVFWKLVIQKFLNGHYFAGMLLGLLYLNATFAWTGVLLLILFYHLCKNITNNKSGPI